MTPLALPLCTAPTSGDYAVPMRDLTDEELDAIDPTDEERAAADRFVRTDTDDGGEPAVFIESTPDMFCVIARYRGAKATLYAVEHRQGIANVLAEVFAMRRVGTRDPRDETGSR